MPPRNTRFTALGSGAAHTASAPPMASGKSACQAKACMPPIDQPTTRSTRSIPLQASARFWARTLSATEGKSHAESPPPSQARPTGRTPRARRQACARFRARTRRARSIHMCVVSSWGCGSCLLAISLEECEVAIALPVRHRARELLPLTALVGKVAVEHGVAEHLSRERVGYSRAPDPDMLAKGLGMNDAK